MPIPTSIPILIPIVMVTPMATTTATVRTHGRVKSTSLVPACQSLPTLVTPSPPYRVTPA